jgi:hypothetical protein
MAGRGSFQAIAPDDVARLLALEGGERWDFAAAEVAAKFVERMDKLWAPIHCALSDGTIDGTLGEPPLAQSENSSDSTRPPVAARISARRMSRCRAFRLSACDGRRSAWSHGHRLRSTNASSSRAHAHTSTTLYNTKLTVNAPRLAYTFRTCC